MNRRNFLELSAFSLAGLRAGTSFAQMAAPIAETPFGRIAGEGRGTVKQYLGIPFAQPPIGPLRFRPPQPPAKWEGVRQATSFASAAPQPGSDLTTHSEDCLYLNIWAPQRPGSYPVFVWIHGGGFTGGKAADPLFNGTAFAEMGIVVVTVAYRLGVLGFLDMEPLLGPSYAGSANNALKDLTAALAWIHESISAFGGDPARVTLGGESAGAKLTDLLMGTTAAAPLFQAMISESGGAERVYPRDHALKVADGFASTWTATGLPRSSVLTAPAEQLIAAQEQFMRSWPEHFPLRPEIDGVFLSKAPLESIKAGASRGKRLLIGTNREESALFIGPQPEKDPGARDLGNMPVSRFLPIEAAYRKLYPDMPEPLLRIRSLSAEEYLVPSTRVLEAHVGTGGEAYAYRFDFPGDGRFAGLAFHSYELRFVWDHFGKEVPSASAQQLAAAMHSAWATFLQGAAPTGPGLPRWAPFTMRSQETMILNAKSMLQKHPEQAELKLWKGLLED